MAETSTGSSRPRLRVGLVGCGAVAERYHLPALLASRDVDVVATVDTAIERARSLASLAGAPQALAHHMELPGKVDLAIVTVPNAFHEPVTADLLAAGVHVLVEKPMARTTVECDRMIAAAAASQAVLAVGHDFRYFPVARFARDLFATSLLGGIRHVELLQGAGSGWPSVSADVLSPRAGGGTLMTFGVHMLDLLCWWFGDMRVVAYRDDAAGGVEAEAEALFELAGSAPVHLAISSLRSMRDTFIVECERGTAEIGIHEPALVRLSLNGGSPGLIGNVPDAEFQRAPLLTVFARQLADVVAAVRGTGGTPVGGAEARRAVALVEACYRVRQPLRRPWDYPEAFAVTGGTPE